MIRLPIRFVEEMARASGIERVLSIAAAWLPKLVDADRAKITFLDGDRLIARSYRRDGQHDPKDDIAPIRPGSPRARVLADGAPLQLGPAEIARDPDPSMQQLYDAGMRQMLFLPMQAGGGTVGVIALARAVEKVFTFNQMQQLTAAGNWMAGQAYLYRQLRANARLAETDPLTGLANRARLMRVLNGPGMLGEPDAKGRVIGVLHIDLDDFKEINDRLGHPAGDQILRHAAATMRSCVTASDLVARVGGDEFVIVTRSDPRGRHIAALAERLSDALAAPLPGDGAGLSCAASIGTALAPPGETSADRLIANADLALYEVKRAGGGGTRAFSDGLRRRVEEQRRLSAEMERALADRTLAAAYQPILSLASGAVTSCEVLARWQHPDRGELTPKAFLPLATELGFGARIDAAVRDRGLDGLRQLRTDGTALPQLSFNACAATLRDPDLPETLMWEVLGKGLKPADIAVEVAERMLVADADGLVEHNITALSDLGFGVVIDDFGLSHASMTQMRRMKVRGLKLGRALTAHLSDPCSAAILRAILAMAGELGLIVTAKGVDTEADIARLAGLNCHQAQGNAIAPPMPADLLPDYLARHGVGPVRVAV